jgi:hypothetical protein
MSTVASTISAEPKHGSKTLRVSVRFWTNDIADTPGHIVPRHGWTSGVVNVERNEAHGVERTSVPFHSMAEIPAAIEQAIADAGITLHLDKREQRYLA